MFHDDWAVSYWANIDPEAVSDRPPFCHVFDGEWPNIQCVPIRNEDRGVVVSGRGRGHGRTCALLQVGLEAEARRTRDEAVALAAEKTELDEYHRKYGPTFVTIESDDPTPIRPIRKVTFRTEVGQFEHSNEDETTGNIVLLPLPTLWNPSGCR